jgi:D-methionine transport system substrate-binding protein
MKKITVSLFMAVLMLIFAVCAEKDTIPEPARQTLKVGATPVPHGELLNLIKEDLAAQNVIMEVIPYTDTVKANVAVLTGELDANYMQHLPYLEVNDYWMERLIATFAVHIEPFAFYSSKYASTADLPNGAVIAIPNDPANIGRALLLLETNGLITLGAGTGLRPSLRDITGNPRGFRFLELPVSELPRSFEEADLAGINGNYALEAGLNPISDSLLVEGGASPYVNIVVVQKDKARDPRIRALQNALLSQKVKSYIGRKWSDGSVVPVF